MPPRGRCTTRRCRYGPVEASTISHLASPAECEEHLGDVIAGYGTDVDRDLIHAWWSLRCLTSVRWLAEHAYG